MATPEIVPCVEAQPVVHELAAVLPADASITEIKNSFLNPNVRGFDDTTVDYTLRNAAKIPKNGEDASAVEFTSHDVSQAFGNYDRASRARGGSASKETAVTTSKVANMVVRGITSVITTYHRHKR